MTSKELMDLTRNAQIGDMKSQASLGITYYLGDVETPKDLEKAAFWFLKAAEQGHLEAQEILGSMYMSGNGITQNYPVATKWIRRAALRGSCTAQYTLGTIYFFGFGTPEDPKEAAGWFVKSAEQGNADAYAILGTMFQEGKGVGKDSVAAERWCRKAANLGKTESMVLLGSMLMLGEGVPEDLIEGYAWISLAYAYGNQAANKMRTVVEPHLSNQQRLQGLELGKQLNGIISAGSKGRISVPG